jgi:hypothetical protein
MSEQSEITPRWLKCFCQHCNGEIEFDANALQGEAKMADCPHCHRGTVIFETPPPVIPALFCRNCGKPVNPAAIACLSCGAPPQSQTNFCWHCGKPTSAVQIICVLCGVSLEGPKADVPEHKSKLAAGLLAIFLGCLGIHKFYLGYAGAGIVLLLISIIGGCLTCGFALWVTAFLA